MGVSKKLRPLPRKNVQDAKPAERRWHSPSRATIRCASFSALVLLVWFLDSYRRAGRSILPLLWLTVLVTSIARPPVTQLRWKAYLDLPVGRSLSLSRCFTRNASGWPSELSLLITFLTNRTLRSLSGCGACVEFLPFDPLTTPGLRRCGMQSMRWRDSLRFVNWNSDVDHEEWAARHPERRSSRRHAVISSRALPSRADFPQW